MEVKTNHSNGNTTTRVVLVGSEDAIAHEEEFMTALETIMDGLTPEQVIAVEFAVTYSGERRA